MKKIDLPLAFVNRVREDSFLGEELITALNTSTPTSIRLNSAKPQRNWENATIIPWSRNGLLLAERPIFTLDPHFHAGSYYPQEAGSQFIDHILRQLPFPEEPVFLDLCAAPGGKSTLIADFLTKKGLLVANEVIQNRSKVLKENLIKWGSHHALVSNNDPADFKNTPNTFDCILIDAPCSGEGMFRKDTDARSEWSEENVQLCSARQKRIVMDVVDALKPGGYLIYSTCTFNQFENEDNINWFQQEADLELVTIQIPHAKPGRDGIGYYALPNLLDTEGFYVCVLRKKEEEIRNYKSKSKQRPQLTTVKPEVWIYEWIKDNSAISILQWNQYLFAVPETHVELIQQLHSKLRIIKLGTEMGELGKKGLIPHEALALDNYLLSDGVPTMEFTLEQALHYLKGETFPVEGKQQHYLVQFEGNNLGWIKHLGNRFNNLYPKEWRIRMRID